MSFILSCILYSFLGTLTGFLAHIFNGLIQTTIHFDWEYVKRTFFNFGKILVAMTFTSLIMGIFVTVVPDSLLVFLETDRLFLHQLVFYLMAFASFDFGLQN